MPPTAVTPTPFGTPPQKGISKALGVVLITGALASVIMGVVILRGSSQLGMQPLFASHSNGIAIAIGSSPASVLYTIDTGSKKIEPLQLEKNGKTYSVVDVVSGKDTPTYFLLSDTAASSTSNLFELSTNGTLVQLTDSASMKYDLTYAPEFGYLAYDALPKNKLTSSLVLYDIQAKKEIALGQGQQPRFVNGSRVLAYGVGGVVHITIIPQAKGSTTMALLPGLPFAFNSEGTQLADYNATSRNVDLYALTKESMLDFKKSLEIPDMPQALGFINDDLIAAAVTSAGGTSTLMYYHLGDSPKDATVIPLTIPGIAWRMYTYDY